MLLANNEFSKYFRGLKNLGCFPKPAYRRLRKFHVQKTTCLTGTVKGVTGGSIIVGRFTEKKLLFSERLTVKISSGDSGKTAFSIHVLRLSSTSSLASFSLIFVLLYKFLVIFRVRWRSCAWLHNFVCNTSRTLRASHSKTEGSLHSPVSNKARS